MIHPEESYTNFNSNALHETMQNIRERGHMPPFLVRNVQCVWSAVYPKVRSEEKLRYLMLNMSQIATPMPMGYRSRRDHQPVDLSVTESEMGQPFNWSKAEVDTFMKTYACSCQVGDLTILPITGLNSLAKTSSG